MVVAKMKERVKKLLEFLEENGETTYKEIAKILGEEIAYKDGRGDSFIEELCFNLKLIESIHEDNVPKKQTVHQQYVSKLNRFYRITLQGLEYLNNLKSKELQSKQVDFNKILALTGIVIALVTILKFISPEFKIKNIIWLGGEFWLFIALILLLILLLYELLHSIYS